MAAAFQAIGRACLRQLAANERILAETRDPEVVHQMRVALRRLRAAMSVFKEVVADPGRDAVRRELTWIARELGEARDLDVFIAGVLEPVCGKHPDEPGLVALTRSFRDARERAYDRILSAAASARYRRLVIDTAAWIEAGPWPTTGGAACVEPVEGFARGVLAQRRRTVRKRGRHLADLEPSARHEVRIAAKKLRYATEFFAPLFEDRTARKRLDAFLSALEELQDHLGELNDLAVSRERHPDWFRPEPDDAGSATHARHLVAKHQASRGEHALRPALDAYRDFAKAKPFWR